MLSVQFCQDYLLEGWGNDDTSSPEKTPFFNGQLGHFGVVRFQCLGNILWPSSENVSFDLAESRVSSCGGRDVLARHW